ncbi:hypothetical protein OROGR_029239 [Orobanche gracilis]
MGCNISRLDSHGTSFPARLRPLLLQRFEDIKTRRQAGRALKEPTPSKKELLMDKDIIEEENNASQHLIISPNSSKIIKAYSIDEREDFAGENESIDIVKKVGDRNGHDVKEIHVVKNEGLIGMDKIGMDESPVEDFFTDAGEDEEDDDDDDDDGDVNGRTIGYEDDEAFPGSPSFRVYFNDNSEADEHIDIRKKDAFKATVSSESSLSSKESSVEKKVNKKGKKRRSFRKVLPKNLLSVKSCYTPSSHSSHDDTHLLTGKTTT